MNEIGIYLLIVNALGFYMMWSDKRKAIKDAWKTNKKAFIIRAYFPSFVSALNSSTKAYNKNPPTNKTINIAKNGRK